MAEARCLQLIATLPICGKVAQSTGADMLNEVGSVLRAARVAAGISQGDLADALGIPSWTLSKVEHGTRTFDVEWIWSLPEPIRERVSAHVRAKHIGQAWRIPRYEADAVTA